MQRVVEEERKLTGKLRNALEKVENFRTQQYGQPVDPVNKHNFSVDLERVRALRVQHDQLVIRLKQSGAPEDEIGFVLNSWSTRREDWDKQIADLELWFALQSSSGSTVTPTQQSLDPPPEETRSDDTVVPKPATPRAMSMTSRKSRNSSARSTDSIKSTGRQRIEAKIRLQQLEAKKKLRESALKSEEEARNQREAFEDEARRVEEEARGRAATII